MKDLSVGEVLDDAWRLEEPMGQGAQARVFRATDLKLGRQAAIKVLLASHVDDDTVTRFEREAQVMLRLRHRNIVTVYAVGRARGIPWLAMQHLDGRSLGKVVAERGGKVPPDVLLPIARQLLVTLSWLHGQRLVHGDVKPSNIHVAPHGHVTLLDLGLTRGDPDHLAPEQQAGERAPDGRADLYSLSVVLYRALAGAAPFASPDFSGPRPDISKVAPHLSSALGAVLQKGLAIRPEDRFGSAEELLTALERAMASRAREAPTTSPPKPSASTEPHPVLIRPVVVADPDLVPTDAVVIPSNLRAPAPAPAPAPTAGRKITVEAMPVVALDAAIDSIAAAGGLKGGQGLQDDDDAHDVQTNPDGFQSLEKQRTDPEGFEQLSMHTPPMPAPVPLPPAPARTLVDDVAPVERVTEPSQPKPAVPVAAPPPLPAYLKPQWLFGAALLLVLLGVVLGKLL